MPQPDPTQTRRVIRQLTALDDVPFAEALADNVMDPVAEETAAFRSDELARRSLAATQYLINNVNSTIKKNAGESNKGWQHRAEHYRSRIGMERRQLLDIVRGMDARLGRINNAPQPRRRAEKRLWNLVLADKPVSRETLRQLLEEEQQKDIDAREKEKERRKAAKRAAKASAASSQSSTLAPNFSVSSTLKRGVTFGMSTSASRPSVPATFATAIA